MMKKLLKEYEAPLCDVVEVRAEGVLAASDVVYNQTEGSSSFVVGGSNDLGSF